jgi:hypothetical protein
MKTKVEIILDPNDWYPGTELKVGDKGYIEAIIGDGGGAEEVRKWQPYFDKWPPFLVVCVFGEKFYQFSYGSIFRHFKVIQ